MLYSDILASNIEDNESYSETNMLRIDSIASEVCVLPPVYLIREMAACTSLPLEYAVRLKSRYGEDE